MDKRVCLKVKLKSLAEESRIIRKEERKARTFKSCLREHRIMVVRHESRHTHLAYGFIRGFRYEQLESKCKRGIPNWDKVRRMVEAYGIDISVSLERSFWARKQDQMNRLEEWIKTAETYIKDQKSVV